MSVGSVTVFALWVGHPICGRSFRTSTKGDKEIETSTPGTSAKKMCNNNHHHCSWSAQCSHSYLNLQSSFVRKRGNACSLVYVSYRPDSYRPDPHTL